MYIYLQITHQVPGISFEWDPWRFWTFKYHYSDKAISLLVSYFRMPNYNLISLFFTRRSKKLLKSMLERRGQSKGVWGKKVSIDEKNEIIVSSHIPFSSPSNENTAMVFVYFSRIRRFVQPFAPMKSPPGRAVQEIKSFFLQHSTLKKN